MNKQIYLLHYSGEYFTFKLRPWGTAVLIDRQSKRELFLNRFELLSILGGDRTGSKRFERMYGFSVLDNTVLFPATAIHEFVVDADNKLDRIEHLLNQIDQGFKSDQAYMSLKTKRLTMPEAEFRVEAAIVTVALEFTLDTMTNCTCCGTLTLYFETSPVAVVQAHVEHIVSNKTVYLKLLAQYIQNHTTDLGFKHAANICLMHLVDYGIETHHAIMQGGCEKVKDFVLQSVSEVFDSAKAGWKNNLLSSNTFRQKLREKVFQLEYCPELLMKLLNMCAVPNQTASIQSLIC